MRFVGRMVSISSSNSIHIQALGQAGEHGTRVASLHQEEEVLVHLVIVHILNRRNQVLLLNCVVSDNNFSRIAMGSKINDNIVISSRMKSTRVFLLRQLLQLLDISSHDSKHHSSLHLKYFVINMLQTARSVILARSTRTVISEKCSRNWVQPVLGYIGSAHEDDVVGIHSSSNQILVHTATLRLDTIIGISVSGSNNDSMSISHSDRQDENQTTPVHLRRQLYANENDKHQFGFHQSYL